MERVEAGQVEVATVAGRQLVKVRGGVDLAVADEMRDVLDRHIAKGAAVLVDCSEIVSIDCCGLSALICARYAAIDVATSFQLVDLSAAMRLALQTAGIEDLFSVAEPFVPHKE